MEFIIYGAGIVAMNIYTIIKEKYQKRPVCFLVSSGEQSPCEIDGISVRTLEDAKGLMTAATMQYIVAMPQVHHESVKSSLMEHGVTQEQMIMITSEVQNSLEEEYFRTQTDLQTIKEVLESSENSTGESKKTSKLQKSQKVKKPQNLKQQQKSTNLNIAIYQAKCHLDKSLSQAYPRQKYIFPIQVGAALTTQRIAEYCDNEGDNISVKNPNYCELTATYYAWKHSEAEYKGLYHYRRLLDVTEQQLEALFGKQEVDVILPYPSMYYPSMAVEHERYVTDTDWEAMLRAMQDVAPMYAKAYEEQIAGTSYFYNYNMLIAHKSVFDEYCSFVFSVLERTEELLGVVQQERADRFAGYLGENLTTIFFLANKDRWRIAHTGKILLN